MEMRSWWKQAWTITKIEMRRAFFSKRAFWVYGLALFPSIIFLGYSFSVKLQAMSLSSQGLAKPAQLDGIRVGESDAAILQRLGKAPRDFQWTSSRRLRAERESNGITTHIVTPAYEARFVRLNILQATYTNDRTARIYEFEAYGNGPENLALKKPATSSEPCSANEGPEKALNGSVKNGPNDRWCSREWNNFLQVDLGAVYPIQRIVIKHAGAGGEQEEHNTCVFNIQAGKNNTTFATIVNATGARLVDEITANRRLTYFDGHRETVLSFKNGKLEKREFHPLMNFEEDRRIFAGVFQFFYLRLAIFFGCLGIFMNLFRGEMLDKTLHFWFLAPAKREVLLAGKYGAGLIASTVIFTAGALLCFGIMVWSHNAIEVQAFWDNAGLGHAFWYAMAAALGCVGYGSVFLAAGLLLRNPIIPAAVLLVWESINGFLPALLQKASVLYYLQSLCPVPAPFDKDVPALLQLLLAPATPASHAGAILGLFAVTAVVLWLSCLAIRRMQISYGGE
jgi:hypothetical protein